MEKGNTREAIAESLKKLTEGKEFEKISVGEICENCGITRKSFYYHFRDKYDLVSWIFRNEFMDKAAEVGYKNFMNMIDALLKYLASERTYYRSVFSYSGQNSFKDTFIESMMPLVECYAEILFPACDDRVIRTGSYFFCGGVASMIKDWLMTNISAEKLIETDHYLMKEAARIIHMQQTLKEVAGGKGPFDAGDEKPSPSLTQVMEAEKIATKQNNE